MSDRTQERTSDDIIAVVTGANRGIGFEVCRQLAHRRAKVVLTARNRGLGLDAADKLRNEGLAVDFHELEITEARSIQTLKQDLENRFGRIDVLVNNAGAGDKSDKAALQVEIDAVRRALEVNCFGALRVIQALTPLLKSSRGGRIINISSGMGALSTMRGGLAAYRISKAALNSLTIILSNELEDSSIAVNAMCPGWVNTRMGGTDALRSVEEGADTAVWLALDAPTTLRGKFLRDRQIIPW